MYFVVGDNLAGWVNLRKGKSVDREHYCNGGQGLSLACGNPVEIGTTAVTP